MSKTITDKTYKELMEVLGSKMFIYDEYGDSDNDDEVIDIIEKIEKEVN